MTEGQEMDWTLVYTTETNRGTDVHEVIFRASNEERATKMAIDVLVAAEHFDPMDSFWLFKGRESLAFRDAVNIEAVRMFRVREAGREPTTIQIEGIPETDAVPGVLSELCESK